MIRRKQRAWQSSFQLVLPTQWLAKRASESPVTSSWPRTVIPNALPTDVYRPLDVSVARHVLGLPSEVPLIGFGALDGRDPRKGLDLLEQALELLAHELPNLQAVIFGQSQPQHKRRLPLPVHWMGRLHDDVTLALVYCSVDALVVPSRIDNLPQTGTEAQACGTPVVAFRTSGLTDVVLQRETGYLAEPFVVEELVRGIQWVLEWPRRRQLGEAARRRAVRRWSPAVVAAQHEQLYITLLDNGRSAQANE